MQSHLPGEGNIFTAKPEPLVDLLSGIHTHRVALPSFQRRWVWEPDMVRDLVISVAYRYPAGSLLTLRLAGNTFALRPFEGAGEELRIAPSLVILDGQQRLTSLYQALYRQEGVQARGRRYHFYLDVSALMAEPAESTGTDTTDFESALFYVAAEKNGRRARYQGLRVRYELATREQELAAGALPLGCIFEPGGYVSAWKRDYLAAQAEQNVRRYVEIDGRWDRMVAPWIDRLRSYPFPVVELRPDIPLGALCRIFEKVNSTGVALDVFDLVTAILGTQDFNLHEQWTRTRRELAPALPLRNLSGTHFLQALSLLDSFQRQQTDPQGGITVTGRREDLMALKADAVRTWWAPLVAGYREAGRFLAGQGVLSERILPSAALVIPLAAILAYVKERAGGAVPATAWPPIVRWYWCSVFSQRYSSQVEVAAAEDLAQVIAWLDGADPPAVVGDFAFNADSLEEVASSQNPIYKGVLCLLARAGARDLGAGGPLTGASFDAARPDHYPLFPAAALQQLGIADPRASAIVNQTLASTAVKRSLGGRRPSQWVEAGRHKLGPAVFDGLLASHAVDPALLAADDWEGFVRDRRQRLLRLIEAACGGR